MTSYKKELQNQRPLSRRKESAIRIFTVVSVICVVVLSSFCAAVVRVENIEETSIANAECIEYYAARSDREIRINEELIALSDVEIESFKSDENSTADKEALGEAVGNLYAAVSALNQQKNKMAVHEEAVEPIDDLLELADIDEPLASEPTEDELLDIQTTAAAAMTDASETQTETYYETTPYHRFVSSGKGTVELDENGIPVGFSKVLTGIATAYTGDPITATGTVPTYGTVAVNPKIIPYGSLLYIVSADGNFVYGVAKAEDTGGFIHWNNAPIADLYFDTEAECYNFGRQNVIIYVIS